MGGLSLVALIVIGSFLLVMIAVGLALFARRDRR